MKIKNKLLLGFGLLFIVVLFFGVVSIYYIEEISENSKITLKNNYETLTFTRDMRSVLDENNLPLTTKAAETFDKALKKQENNITEHGEKEATAAVRAGFGLLIDPAQSINQKQEAERSIRFSLKEIDGLNMHAIVLKNNYIHETVTRATLYLGGIVFITFLILFVFIVNFPGFILNPLNQFTEGVDEISKRNYDIRLEFKTGDEFEELARAFNRMAAGLSESENINLTKIFSEEIRLKAIAEEVDGAVIGVSAKQEILFINKAAKEMLHMGEKNVIGRPTHEFTQNHNLLKTIIEKKDTESPLKIDMHGKTSYFQQTNIEIVVPNFKPNPLDTVQFSGYSAGMIYILKQATELVNS
jgi:NtrC-family two-component system sensor histidine kinase KinB